MNQQSIPYQTEPVKSGNKLLIILIVLITVVIVGALGYELYRSKDQIKVIETEAQQAKEKLEQLTTLDGRDQLAEIEAQMMIEEVGKLILLPADEEPIIATVSDSALLIEEYPFYAGVQDGDVVLVYSTAQKAFVYSPSRKILVNVGPVYLEDESTDDTTQSTEPTE